jgi:phage shock protein PspC (stress-responsive transcriptional regulator)
MEPMNTNASTQLTRSSSDKVIGGVAGGLGAHFDVDPVLFRVAFAVSTLFSGAGLIAYLVMLVVLPTDEESSRDADPRSSAVAPAS